MSVKKALVVDDSKLARITLKRKLELRAVDVDMVESASEALSYLQTHQPDIIFMDHLMPDIDGFEATKRIKANPATRHIPVIMCTGKEHEGYLQEATAIGATNILAKPPETAALDAILTMDLEPASSAPAIAPEIVVEVPAFVEPPILQPISMPTSFVAQVLVAEVPVVDAELIDDSFDADAAFGIESESIATTDAVDLMDTSELESLSSFATDDNNQSNDESMLLAMEHMDSLDQESALVSLDTLAADDILSGSIEEMLTETGSDFIEPVIETRMFEEINSEEINSEEIKNEEAAIEEAPVFEAGAFSEPSVIDLPRVDLPRVDLTRLDQAMVESAFAAPHAAESGVAAVATGSVVTYQETLSLIEAEIASRVTTLRETIISDLTFTIRRQLDDMRNVVGESAEQHDLRLRALEGSVADFAATSAPKIWVLEKLPPALDMARLTDDIAARIAIVQNPGIMQSDDLVSVRARLDEVESELVVLRNREAAVPSASAPTIDSSTLQSLLPSLSRQLDALLQQRIPVIVSDISDQVQLQLAYQMNDGRAPASAPTLATPSLDNIITNQADVETQITALKKQLNDEWGARMQVLVKQLKDQLQHAPLPTSINTAELREQWRNDAREDIRRALSEVKIHAGGEVGTDIPVADAGHFEQMLETVTTQFARTQAEYEQKLKQSRLIAMGAVVVSIVVSAALAIFL
jgi:two-component system, cell cycle response regulator